jgi:hypothetical protein
MDTGTEQKGTAQIQRMILDKMLQVKLAAVNWHDLDCVLDGVDIQRYVSFADFFDHNH